MSTAAAATDASQTDSPPVPVLSVAELDADPHGVFRRHRSETPFLRRPDGAFIAIRARDVEQLLTDPRTRQIETEYIAARGITSGPIFDMMGQSMLFSNGAVHRERRAPMSRAFAFRMIAALRPSIRAVAEQLIEAHATTGCMDLLDDYTALIPARTIAAILGLEEEDVPQFTQWVYSFSRAFSASFTQEEIPGIAEGAQHLRDYVEQLIAERRAQPREGFLTDFIKAVDEQDALSPVETISQVVSVILAGSDTTRGAMAIQTALLLQHREQWEAVCADAGAIPGAVIEALRYEPAVATIPRFTSAEIDIDGVVVPAGRILTLSTMSAMRDPALYADPERFDIGRTDHPRWHLVFGGGVHRCLGEALAKAELEEGLAALASRLPQLHLDGAPLRVEGHSGIRRLSGMRVAWTGMPA